VEIRLLGPVELYSGRGVVPIGSPKQRALLAFLALHPKRVVTYEVLIDGLWGPAQPDASVEALRFHVSRLRGILRQVDDTDRLRTRPGGYQLVVDEDAIDVCRFEHAIAGARLARSEGADPDVVSGVLRDALDLWAGPAFADINGEPFVLGERQRLEELRLTASEDYFATELAGGRHSEAVPELERMVDRNPLRERFWELLITALYRSDRQADALAAYQRLRRILADELGLEPSARLRELEHRVLVQDTGLFTATPRAGPVADGDAPPAFPADAPPPPPPPSAPAGRAPRGLAVGALALGIAALGLVWLGIAGALISLAALAAAAIAASHATRATGHTGPLATAALVTSLLALTASSGLALHRQLTTDDTADDTATDRAVPVEGNALGIETPLSELHIADCFVISASSGSLLPANVLVVPCEQPHDAEVYHLFMLVPGPYPGDEEVDELAIDQCTTAFETYVGIPPDRSEVGFRYVRPERTQWELGNRGGGCALVDPDGGRLTGSRLGERR
jgi:DNA-binding SARP family transcriptional activator